jgi:hypothetical protein
MRIRTGYSEELQHNSWAKGDIDLDSNDLEGLAVEFDFNLADLTHTLKYDILYSEAERLLTIKYIRDVQLKSPGSRDMDILKRRLGTVTNLLDKHVQLAKRLSHGGDREEDS